MQLVKTLEIVIGICFIFNISTCYAEVHLNYNYKGIADATYDDETDLLWLDVEKTSWRSYNEVKTLLGSGKEFEGFRYAKIEEIATLFGNYLHKTHVHFLTGGGKYYFYPPHENLEPLLESLGWTNVMDCDQADKKIKKMMSSPMFQVEESQFPMHGYLDYSVTHEYANGCQMPPTLSESEISVYAFGDNNSKTLEGSFLIRHLKKRIHK